MASLTNTVKAFTYGRDVINIEDARLLARVVYILKRNFSHGQIADVVSKILNYPFKKNHAESAVAYQNRTRDRIPDFTMMEELVIEHLSSYSPESV